MTSRVISMDDLDHDARHDGPEHEAPAPRGEILSVHLGPSANCSSIGSFIDFLFLSAIAGGATVAAVAALLDARRPGPADPEAPRGDEEE